MIMPVTTYTPPLPPPRRRPAMKVAAGATIRPPSGPAPQTVWENDPWDPWFAWKPVTTVSKKRVWLRMIYRRQRYWDVGRGYVIDTQYGELFDVISADY